MSERAETTPSAASPAPFIRASKPADGPRRFTGLDSFARNAASRAHLTTPAATAPAALVPVTPEPQRAVAEPPPFAIFSDALAPPSAHTQPLRSSATPRAHAAQPHALVRPPRGECHPVFGWPLVDVGYKRTYLMMARTLSMIPPWCSQRPIDPARVAKIRAKLLDEGSYRLPGTISLFVEEGQRDEPLAQSCAIFDGQHRVAAVRAVLASRAAPRDGVDAPPVCTRAAAVSRACARHAADTATPANGVAEVGGGLDDFWLVVDIYPVASEEEVKAWFVLHNKSERVQEIDLPDAIAPRSKCVIDEAVGALVGRYPKMFSTSEKCRAPHLHRDTLRNRLFGSEIVGNALVDTQTLLARLDRINFKFGERAESDWPAHVRKALPKARLHGFYLGLSDYGWLEQLGHDE